MGVTDHFSCLLAKVNNMKLLIAFFLMILATVAFAQEDGEGMVIDAETLAALQADGKLTPEVLEQLQAMQAKGMLQEEPLSSPHADISAVFPINPSLEFEGGEVAEVLMGFRNIGDMVYNVSAIVASLHHPSDFRYFIQNFTQLNYQAIVTPNHEITLSYPFRPDSLVETGKFGLAITVFYADNSRNYTTTFFNQTVQIVEPPMGFDSQTFFLIAGAIGMATVGGYVLMNRPGSVKKSRPTAATVAAAAAPTEVNSDWLEGTNVNLPGQRQSSSANNKKKKKSKKGK